MNNVKTAALLGLLGAILVTVGWALGGSQMAFVFLGIAVAINFGMYFYSDKIALRASKAVPATEQQLPNVYSIVRSLAQRENMPEPRIYFIDSPQPNAFATGRNPKHAAVAVTRGILDMMDHAELEGVLAHELSHVKNRDVLIATIAATLAAALTFLARMAFWRGLFGGGGRNDNNPIAAIIAIAAMILAPIAAALIQLGISRSREFQADRSGAETTGSPMALARALQKLEAGTTRIPMEVDPAVSTLFIADPMKAFQNDPRRRRQPRSFTKMFSTHPPIPERIERLEEMQMGIR